MGKSIYRAGTVLSGSFAKKGVYNWNDAGFAILSNDEDGKIVVNSLFPTKFTVLQMITSDTVTKVEKISESQEHADANAIATGFVLLGPIGGLLGAAMGKLSSVDAAVYFKNGEKSLIRFRSASAYQELSAKLFEFEQ